MVLKLNLIMITIQHKTTFKKKQVDVREWLDYRPWQASQYTIVQVNQIVKLFYNNRYMGLFEESLAQDFLKTNQYWIVKELNQFDYFNLAHRTTPQRIKGLLAIISGKPLNFIKAT
ncbi:hypothetical protein GCM10027037_20970 [Mucilaginibacter koreensis]